MKHTFLHFSLFRSYSFQSFFSCVPLSLSSTFCLSHLFLCISSTFSFCLSCLSSTFFLYCCLLSYSSGFLCLSSNFSFCFCFRRAFFWWFFRFFTCVSWGISPAQILMIVQTTASYTALYFFISPSSSFSISLFHKTRFSSGLSKMEDHPEQEDKRSVSKINKKQSS